MPSNIKYWICFALALFSLTTHATSTSSSTSAEPVISINFDYDPKDYEKLRSLEQCLKHAMRKTNVGELGETELHLDGNLGYLYMYGVDPDRIDAVVKPILKQFRIMNNAEMLKRYASSTKKSIIIAKASATGTSRCR